MSVFKFTPDFMDAEQIRAIAVGRKGLLSHSAEKILNAARDGRTINMIFVGPRGIGKSHTALMLAYELSDRGAVTLAQLSEEEYSVSSLDGFFSRVLEVLGETGEQGQDAAERARTVFKRYRREGKPVVILAENLQRLFSDMESDLPALRSIMLEDQSFFIIGTALFAFDQITSPAAAFYNFFEINKLKGLRAGEIGKLVKMRLKNLDEISQDFEDVNLNGLRILTGGNPRLIHMLCDIMVQKKSNHGLEKNLMDMLDSLTPFYQIGMDAMPTEKRKVFDALALSDGPSTPTEIAAKMRSKNTAVTAQLMRLRNDGVVERIKLRQKKETRYQISDRLYRVWREFRTRGGRAKTIAFVRFLELWYSDKGLVKEYNKEADALEAMSPGDASVARPRLHAIRCILNAMPDGSKLLEDAVDKFVDAGDYRGAESTIKEFRDKKKSEPINLLSMYNEIVAKNAELRVVSDSRRSDHIDHICKDITEVDRVISTSKDRSGFDIVHTVSKVVEYAIELNVDLAARVNDHARAHLTECKECRCFTYNQISIMYARNDHAGALKVIKDALDRKCDLNMIGHRAMTHALMKDREQAMNDVQILRQAGGFTRVALSVCSRLSMFVQMLEILHEKFFEIKALEKKIRDDVVEDLLLDVTMALHVGEIEAENFEALTECIKTLKPVITSEIMSGDPLRFMIEHSHGVERVGRTLDVLFKALDGDQLGALAILKCAVGYVRDADTDPLERLHPEQRELAFEMITKISPDALIPQEILDSG